MINYLKRVFISLANKRILSLQDRIDRSTEFYKSLKDDAVASLCIDAVAIDNVICQNKIWKWEAFKLKVGLI